MPIATPRAVLAALGVVEPVPPSPTASVPVSEDAPKSTASSVDSMVHPPSAFKSTLTVVPVTSIPSPATGALPPPPEPALIQALPLQILSSSGLALVSSQPSPTEFPALPPVAGATLGAVVPTCIGPTFIRSAPVESLKNKPGLAALVLIAS